MNSTVAKRALGVHSADVPARSRMSSSHQALSGLSQHRNLENSIIEPISERTGGHARVVPPAP